MHTNHRRPFAKNISEPQSPSDGRARATECCQDVAARPPSFRSRPKSAEHHRAIANIRAAEVAAALQASLRKAIPALATAALLATATLAPTPASAIIPVIDIRAIFQLATQIQTMQNQLDTARNQLTEAQSTLTSMTGTRGMQNLLSGVSRNYLPADYQQLLDVMNNASATYSALSAQVQTLLTSNAVLTTTDLSRLTPDQRQLLDAARRSAATLDVLTRDALAATSGRFASIEQLIASIGRADDQKAILDLQARIGAEQNMLQNEATKLDILYHSAEAQERTRALRVREQGIADLGSLRNLAPMGLPAP
jgi:type IV secretion system protein VirB5